MLAVHDEVFTRDRVVGAATTFGTGTTLCEPSTERQASSLDDVHRKLRDATHVGELCLKTLPGISLLRYQLRHPRRGTLEDQGYPLNGIPRRRQPVSALGLAHPCPGQGRRPPRQPLLALEVAPPRHSGVVCSRRQPLLADDKAGLCVEELQTSSPTWWH